MLSRFHDDEAARCADALDERVYTSRLLGRDNTLVLHGGGNTSVKIRERNLFGEEEDILYVKGSGWDLETIERAGFSPCRMAPLLKLAQLESLTDLAMARELKACMTNPSAPAPSVEAILHAILPAKFVDHTHADALIAITNTPGGLARIREVYGDRVVVIPYVMPGFKLARVCAERFGAESHAATIGLVLMNHGLFSFGESARESYERMIELVTLAESYLERSGAGSLPVGEPRGDAHRTPTAVPRVAIASLRRELSTTIGSPCILSVSEDARALAFAQRADVATISQQGPATPDHVIRTKRMPMVGRDVAAYAKAYAEAYRQYVSSGSNGSRGPTDDAAAVPLVMLDAAPRVILDRELGLCTVGRTARDAAIAREIYEHTIDIILRATALGGWQALPSTDIFDVEYWDLEQAKVRAGGKPPLFAGETALVTGAASGIGKACVASLLARGAAVVGVDVNNAVTTTWVRPDYLGIACDLTDRVAIARALDRAVHAFGGLDMLILNAGIFPESASIAATGDDVWRHVMDVNLDATAAVMRESHAVLRESPQGGRVVVIGSKNVPAPGPGASAYSVSKAAVNQLARVAALEWGKDRIRINSIHPNMVFDTALWTPELIASRAAQYGLTTDEYRTRNVLGVSVSSRDVAELAAEMCGPLFAKTTAAQVPVDGGTERVI